jgi:hypothetical protein
MFNSFKKLKRRHKYLFSVLVATGLIAFWRGMWGLLDYLFESLPEVVNYSLSVAIGLGILVLTGYAYKELL